MMTDDISTSFSVNDLAGSFRKDHGGLLIVHMQENRFHAGMLFDQCAHKGILGFERGTAGDNDHQGLVRCNGTADKDVADDTGTGILVIGRNGEAADKIADGGKNGIGLPVLYHAVAHGNEFMTSLTVDPADRFTPGIGSEDGLDLVAVEEGILHAQNWRNRTERLQKSVHIVLLAFKLLRVFDSVKCTATACAGLRALL